MSAFNKDFFSASMHCIHLCFSYFRHFGSTFVAYLIHHFAENFLSWIRKMIAKCNRSMVSCLFYNNNTDFARIRLLFDICRSLFNDDLSTDDLTPFNWNTINFNATVIMYEVRIRSFDECVCCIYYIHSFINKSNILFYAVNAHFYFKYVYC